MIVVEEKRAAEEKKPTRKEGRNSESGGEAQKEGAWSKDEAQKGRGLMMKRQVGVA